jgi:hypothetical protein
MITLSSDNSPYVKNFLIDGGYPGEKFANAIKSIYGAEFVKLNESHTSAAPPKQWVAERTSGGWTRSVGFGKTVNAKFVIHAKSLFWLQMPFS